MANRTIKYGEGTSALPVHTGTMTRGFLNSFFGRYRFIAPNIFFDGWEADIAGIRKSGFVDEVEIKISRADFLADFKKTVQVENPEYDHALTPWDNSQRGTPKWVYMKKHDALSCGLLTPNYFAFLLPPFLVEQCEPDIPDKFGIYEYAPELFHSNVRTIRPARRLHKERIDHDLEIAMLRKVHWRYVNMFSDVTEDE